MCLFLIRNAFCHTNAAAWWRTYYLLTGKRIFLVSGNQSCMGWRQLVLQEKLMCSWIPACTILSQFQVWLQFAVCNRFLLYLSVSRSQHTWTPRTSPLFWEIKLKGSVLPGCIYLAAALLVGTGLLWIWVRCSCLLAAQKPASLQGRCVVVGQLGCVSWIASKTVFCFNRPEWLMIFMFALIAV